MFLFELRSWLSVPFLLFLLFSFYYNILKLSHSYVASFFVNSLQCIGINANLISYIFKHTCLQDIHDEESKNNKIWDQFKWISGAKWSKIQNAKSCIVITTKINTLFISTIKGVYETIRMNQSRMWHTAQIFYLKKCHINNQNTKTFR